MFSAWLLILSFITAALADIDCLTVGTNATATWINAFNQTCTYNAIVGGNFGKDLVRGTDYNCNGRCGASCKGLGVGNVYTQQCLNHDICSFFYNSTDGPLDPNCGKAYAAAAPGFVAGQVLMCGQENILLPPAKPTTGPTCVS